MTSYKVVIKINKNTNPNKTRILLGKNIAYFRQLNNWSQDKLAQKLETDKTTYHKLKMPKEMLLLITLID